MNWKNHESSVLRWLVWSPVVAFFVYIWRHAVNMPYMDDADLVEVVNLSRTGFKALLSLLVRQQNDHRVVFSRLGALLPYWITGFIDFRWTILLGYSNLILLGLAFYRVFKSVERRYLYFLPITILLFSPIVYQVHLWSITAYQYTLSIAFSIFSLYFLQPSKRNWWALSIPLSIAATLTNLDGISTLPLAFLWLLLQGRRREAGYYFLFSLSYCLIYFQNFSYSQTSAMAPSEGYWVSLAKSFLAMTGSLAKVLSDTHALGLSIAGGAIIWLVYIAIKFWRRPVVVTPTAYLRGLLQFDFVEVAFLRVLASAAMIAIGRHMDSMGNMVAIRFQIYSVSIVVLFYLFLLSRMPSHKRHYLGFSFLFGSVLMHGYSYLKYEAAVHYLEAGLKADSYNFTHWKVFLHQYYNLPDPDPLFYANCRFPTYFQEADIRQWQGGVDTVQMMAKENLVITKITNPAEIKQHRQSMLQINLRKLPESVPIEDTYLMVTPHFLDSTVYLLALRQEGGKWLKVKGGLRNLMGEIPDKIPHQPYQLMLCWKAQGKAYSQLVARNVVF
ncbi:hypothetical protein CLV98_104173 [Dyadobacter jejuensis]|uniref:Glucosyltransferase GtrII-like protein n=1 Tax=Dyadobacter jejuensis TaxID=1082580 RepID=A0A316AMK7_9BACT|nr:hypothetical protein [Dyadobacter jejuensis]PWJ58314.1 hypothetical protein CLV98_104173 [Dyadobacter jejuensis]